MSDIDLDIFGIGDSSLTAPKTLAGAAKRRPGRPTNAEKAAERARAEAMLSGDEASQDDVSLASSFRPEMLVDRQLSARELAIIFRVAESSAKTRLAGCRVAGQRAYRAQGEARLEPLYLLPDAASYLCKPKIDLVKYLSSLNSNNIPPHINKTFWDALNARQKYEENAGQLWRYERVMGYLGDVAMRIKDVSLLWIEGLPNRVNMTDADYKELRKQVVDLLKQIAEGVDKLKLETKPLSSLDELDDHLHGDVNVDPEQFLLGSFDEN